MTEYDLKGKTCYFTNYYVATNLRKKKLQKLEKGFIRIFYLSSAAKKKFNKNKPS